MSMVPDRSGSIRVDMLSRPVAAARVANGPGAMGSIETRQVYLIRGSVGA